MEKLAQRDIDNYFDTSIGKGLSVGELVGLFLEGAMVIAGIILLFLIIGGGIAIISGAGSGDSSQVGKGKQAVTSALIGFIIILGAYWVIRIIEIIIDYRILTFNPLAI